MVEVRTLSLDSCQDIGPADRLPDIGPAGLDTGFDRHIGQVVIRWLSCGMGFAGLDIRLVRNPAFVLALVVFLLGKYQEFAFGLMHKKFHSNMKEGYIRPEEVA